MTAPSSILVVETLYLGDLIHTLPLIQALRRAYPAARLDVLCRAVNAPLLGLVRGIDAVRVMDPARHRSLEGLKALIAELRAARYALVLNPGASDRAGWLTALSGGERRLGRVNRRGQRWLAAALHDDIVDPPWGTEPMYWQKLGAFAGPLALGLDAVDFGLDAASVDLAGLGLPPRYLHLSPFASEDLRSLPPAVVVELVAALRAAAPQLPVVVSTGPSARETRRLAAVRHDLAALGAICLVGVLDLPRLAGVIAGASAHIGPDSGPLHLAVALGTPSVGCFLYKNASAEWLPTGAQHASVGVFESRQGGLYGLPIKEIAAAAARWA